MALYVLVLFKSSLSSVSANSKPTSVLRTEGVLKSFLVHERIQTERHERTQVEQTQFVEGRRGLKFSTKKQKLVIVCQRVYFVL